MTGWLALSNEQRRATLEQAWRKSGIGPKAIEKDWWVTLALKALFEGPYRKYMIFKGGTSLSKSWNLIERFSEDIDIALDAKAFDMEHKAAPTKGDIERLKRRGCAFTSMELKAALEGQLTKMGVPEGMISITAAEVNEKMPDKDPQVLMVGYPPLYEANPYLRDEVRVEVSVRSLKEPYTQRGIQSILYTWFPNEVYAEIPLEIAVVDPRKTCLEKAFLLHEEFMKPDLNKIRIERMSRHLYDLYRLDRSGVSDKALADNELYAAIIEHRKQYSRLKHVRYETLERATISFCPPGALWKVYQEDYAKMQDQMIYGNSVSFEELMEGLEVLQAKFRGNS
ncbi:nucleotidyl transferase AbiEii/AbiGii toxin family protein [Dinghuibacter silviterrae]|uniref:Nucleotidyltransferase AbiEii toxin of type IV toxin-antitoxin system n=1 Tax=Dinghuibacter silviterrae TaxID=1539049 RepID=A0A4V3GKN5_9BACT|nr:nucleotidyl transferase AbiEii/AbiGii toxin family protein [Dinghuibacter silviterrae]TDW96272.1 nucleotidyltransferase AbiEii toxin of type IV toxin-antitoxin system [Dinghuibacter silviterrae]